MFEDYYDGIKEKFENTKGVIIIRKSKKNRQHNGQRKRTNNDSSKIKQKN